MSMTQPGFEGCEKKLEIDFLPVCDLRNITRATWDSILTEARCTIIGEAKNDFFDSYILSESSLFVFPHKVLIKTCGTTRLLHALPKLLKATKEIGTSPKFVQFSRSNFIFPDVQPFPHRSFSMEVKFLNTFFRNGQSYVMGPADGPRWHLYIADIYPSKIPETEQTFEILMFDLDRNVMRQFYNRDCLDEKTNEVPATGAEATVLSGIDKLIPGSTVDAHLFKPCGYSCNGLKDDTYFTIHITPEPQCSFVSFETNWRTSNYDDLVQRVLETFKPGRFCMSLFVDKASMAKCSKKSFSWEHDDYETTWHAFQHMGNYNACCGHFSSLQNAQKHSEEVAEEDKEENHTQSRFKKAKTHHVESANDDIDSALIDMLLNHQEKHKEKETSSSPSTSSSSSSSASSSSEDEREDSGHANPYESEFWFKKVWNNDKEKPVRSDSHI